MHQRRMGKSNGRGSNMSYGGGGGGRAAGDHLSRGGGGGFGGSMSASETNRNIMEQQNNDRVAELSDQVARLKSLTVAIGDEVQEQNSLLDNMEDGFSNVRDMLGGSLRRIGTMLERGGAKHMMYMVGFVVFVMIFLYWVMTHKGQRGA